MGSSALHAGRQTGIIYRTGIVLQGLLETLTRPTGYNVNPQLTEHIHSLIKEPVGILGYGVEGKSTVDFLLKHGFKSIMIYDQHKPDKSRFPAKGWAQILQQSIDFFHQHFAPLFAGSFSVPGGATICQKRSENREAARVDAGG